MLGPPWLLSAVVALIDRSAVGSNFTVRDYFTSPMPSRVESVATGLVNGSLFLGQSYRNSVPSGSIPFIVTSSSPKKISWLLSKSIMADCSTSSSGAEITVRGSVTEQRPLRV
jgi:hypothetical protein